ncbi:toprim domain-containing protein [Desulfotalea psychrophila]|uniref:Toprim domain-containing protein n=1 Tax=Desulfotalea psychrophila (strain LSv54 / DSM 12343) TaxID=177439 RepID=Q6AR74_DESPS|nr:toprim domain-containing protein [Desulfotalea psychrophila]CAG35150.1 conserved hypothetical protein [Desulfotalea psychrophila LSv54]
MKNKLAEKCYQALKASEYCSARTKENGRTIANLVCPVCGDKTAWAVQQEPYSINCNRANSCGAKTKTRDLFNITFDIEQEYKPTKSDPHKPAREYLKGRGLSAAVLEGLDFRYWKNTRQGLKTGAVMFPVGKDSQGKDVYNGRLFNPPQGEGKTHNNGSTSGLWWTHPARPLEASRPVAVVEGIIDALSLLQMEVQAIAVLSSGQDPAKLEGLEKYQLICAFDNDKAGTLATKKYLGAFSAAQAIMPPEGLDWNDILQRARGEGEQLFKENEQGYRCNANLSLAESAHHYGKLYYEYFGNAAGLFVFDGCTWYSEVRIRGEATQAKTERVGLFVIDVVSFINIGNQKQREYLYQLRVTPLAGRPVDCVASGKTLAAGRDFGAFLLSSAKVNFEGKNNAITALATMIATSKAPEVRQIPVAGYDPQTNWYVFDSFAIDPKGRLLQKDRRGLFRLDHSSMLSPAPQAGDKAITPLVGRSVDVGRIYSLFYAAWGANGAMAFSWTLASWFVNQIKARENFFPFLSLYGAPAAGKSALATKLQSVQGRDVEGLPLSQLNTKKGLARKMAGFSGIFTALLEDNQRNERSFDYSILLTAYNTGSLQVQAKFTNTLETAENPFLGALLFVQNNEPFNQKAEKQRVVSLNFKEKDLDGHTRCAFDELNNMAKEELATVIVEVLRKRGIIEANWYEEYRIAIADLELVQEERIRNNHAIVLAFHRLFCKLFEVEDIDIFSHVEQVGMAKEQSSAELEINEASTFFEQVFSLEGDQVKKYWHEVALPQGRTKIDYNSLYFSLQELIRLLHNNGLQPPRIQDLQKALRSHPAYISHGTNHRFPTSENESHSVQRKAWKFDLEKFRNLEAPPHQIA